MSDVEVVGGAPRFSRDAIQRLVGDACRRAGAVRAILFGSYARDRADALSDVDLLIVCPTELPFLERWRLFADLRRAFPGCDLLVYTPKEVEELRGGGVVHEALATGVLLYEAGPGEASR